MPVAWTHLIRDSGNTEDSLCNWVQLTGFNTLLILCGCRTTGQLTSAKTAPYLNALSTTFSIDPLIIGAYSSCNTSSSWIVMRWASTYVNLLACVAVRCQSH